MAPEQARGNKYAYPVDVWALGCVLFNMMVRDVPQRPVLYVECLMRGMPLKLRACRGVRHGAEGWLSLAVCGRWVHRNGIGGHGNKACGPVSGHPA